MELTLNNGVTMPALGVFQSPPEETTAAVEAALASAPDRFDDRNNVMEDETIGQIARAHGKSPAQVMLRWHLQQGRSAIPTSVDPERIAQNIDVFDVELSADEIALDTGVRNGPDPDVAREERFAIAIPEA